MFLTKTSTVVKNFLTVPSVGKQKQSEKNKKTLTGVQRKNLAGGVRNPYSRSGADTYVKILKLGIEGVF